VRNGARELLARAVETEVEQFLADHAHLQTDDGRKRLVRHLSIDVSNTHIDDICPSGKSRPVLARSLFPNRVFVIGSMRAAAK